MFLTRPTAPAVGQLVEIDSDACYVSRGGDWTSRDVQTLKIRQTRRFDSETIFTMCKLYREEFA
jgi:hypothetical protein